jgi:NAD-dependent deacetylase
VSYTEQLKEWVGAAESIAVLTGAGISTGSGIPDFRSAGGIYSDGRNANVFDLPAFRRDPSIYYNFAREFYPKVRNAQPNAAHRALAAWQKRGKDVTVITQNVDDYHQRAGSSPVCAVHGSYLFSTCQDCGARIETEELFPVIARGDIPHCVCGGVYKPDITFFGELLPEADWNASVRAIRRADLLLVLGTSLSVYPAAVLPAHRPRACRLVVINRDPNPLDREADLAIHDDLCSVMRDLRMIVKKIPSQ